MVLYLSQLELFSFTYSSDCFMSYFSDDFFFWLELLIFTYFLRWFYDFLSWSFLSCYLYIFFRWFLVFASWSFLFLQFFWGWLLVFFSKYLFFLCRFFRSFRLRFGWSVLCLHIFEGPNKKRTFFGTPKSQIIQMNARTIFRGDAS